jgi:hypothetical protein
MPVQTESDAWKEAEERKPRDIKILEFLQESPHQAYSVEELMSEVSNVKSLGDIDIEAMGRNDEESVLGELIGSAINQSSFRNRISALHSKGDVEVRNVPESEIEKEAPEGSDTVTLISYSD